MSKVSTYLYIFAFIYFCQNTIRLCRFYERVENDWKRKYIKANGGQILTATVESECVLVARR